MLTLSKHAMAECTGPATVTTGSYYWVRKEPSIDSKRSIGIALYYRHQERKLNALNLGYIVPARGRVVIDWGGGGGGGAKIKLHASTEES